MTHKNGVSACAVIQLGRRNNSDIHAAKTFHTLWRWGRVGRFKQWWWRNVRGVLSKWLIPEWTVRAKKEAIFLCNYAPYSLINWPLITFLIRGIYSNRMVGGPLTPDIYGVMALWFFRRRAQNTKIGQKSAKIGPLDPSFYFLGPRPHLSSVRAQFTNAVPEKIWARTDEGAGTKKNKN